jgi:hypothetical protein
MVLNRQNKVMLAATAVLVGFLTAGCTGSPTDSAIVPQQYAVSGTPKTLAEYSVAGYHYELQKYTSATGQPCVAVYSPGLPVVPTCAIPLSTRRPINSAFIDVAKRHVCLVFGAVDPSVMRVYSLSGSASRLDVALYRVSGSLRYFLVISINNAVSNIIAVSHSGQFSLQRRLRIACT